MATQETGLNLVHLTLLLTILDKEANNSLYYKRMTPEYNDEYVNSIYSLQRYFASIVPSHQLQNFLQGSPHLIDCFGYRIDEFQADEWDALTEKIPQPFTRFYPNKDFIKQFKEIQKFTKSQAEGTEEYDSISDSFENVLTHSKNYLY